MNEIICPLLTTNTVVEEDGTVKIGTQPVYCSECQCAWGVEGTQKWGVAAIGGERHGKR